MKTLRAVMRSSVRIAAPASSCDRPTNRRLQKHSVNYAVAPQTHAVPLRRISELLEQVDAGSQVVATDPISIVEDVTVPRRDSTITAWVNVIYGCNERCTYCVVPNTRGEEQSREPDAIMVCALKIALLYIPAHLSYAWPLGPLVLGYETCRPCTLAANSCSVVKCRKNPVSPAIYLHNVTRGAARR